LSKRQFRISSLELTFQLARLYVGEPAFTLLALHLAIYEYVFGQIVGTGSHKQPQREEVHIVAGLAQ
jgi:hypothetical protein